MKISWLPILGAVGALSGVKIIGHYFGMTASVVALSVLLIGWLGAYLFYRRLLVKIRVRMDGMNKNERAEFLAGAAPDIRKDLERMEANEKKA